MTTKIEFGLKNEMINRFGSASVEEPFGLQKSLSPVDELKERVNRSIEALKESNQNFENALDTYTSQYGKDVISVSEPIDLAETVDPVAIILGRNCIIYYHDSKKELMGTSGSLELKAGIAYILGRREPQDSKLVAWNPIDGREVELTEYNPSASRIPSRIHGVIVVSNENRVYFADLSSSGGTVLVGDFVHAGAFVKIYDPGSPKLPTIKVDRVNTSRQA